MDDFEIIQDNPFVILDDVSYSGSQMSQMLHEIYYHVYILKKQKIPDIHVLLLAVNSQALELLNKVPRKYSNPPRHSNIAPFYRDFTTSPFHIHYLDEYKYPTLIEKLGTERYSYLNLFFSPTTEQHPYLSLYLDHKIADEASTYMKALIYGPIVPADYNYQKMFENNDSNAEFVKNYPVNQLIENILRDNLDVIDKPNTEFRLCPFIHSCYNQYFIHQMEKQIRQSKMDYSLFISQQENIIPDGAYSYKFPIETDTEEIIKKIKDFRCPTSFYKDKSWRLINTSSRGTKSYRKSTRTGTLRKKTIRKKTGSL